MAAATGGAAAALGRAKKACPACGGNIPSYVKSGMTIRCDFSKCVFADIEEQKEFIGKCLGSHTHIKTYIEVKSHNPNHVPELEKALKLSRARQANLVAARLGSKLYNLKIIGMLMETFEEKPIKGRN